MQSQRGKLEFAGIQKASRQISNPFGKNKGFFVYPVISWLFCLIITQQSVPARAQTIDSRADLQFFGDLFITDQVLAHTKSTPDAPKVFQGTKALLSSARINIANFEGVASAALVPFELKKHLLRMSLQVPELLRKVGVHGVTLANNHTMDFGWVGLSESMDRLTTAGIAMVGAGINLGDAARPLYLPIGRRVACIFSLSRTLPESFWAKPTRPGSASLPYEQTKQAISNCAQQKFFTIVVFHWGQEMMIKPRAYQKELAKLVIDAGAEVVIGHHPHVLQEIGAYKGKPIFYSIGNFVFNSATKASAQQGMAVRIFLDGGHLNRPRYELVPIDTQYSVVGYIPQLFGESKRSPLDPLVPQKFCQKGYSRVFAGTYFQCEFAQDKEDNPI